MFALTCFIVNLFAIFVQRIKQYSTQLTAQI